MWEYFNNNYGSNRVNWVVAPDLYTERYILHSLEDVDIFEYLYYYLKHQEYDAVITFKLKEHSLVPFVYDRTSFNLLNKAYGRAANSVPDETNKREQPEFQAGAQMIDPKVKLNGSAPLDQLRQLMLRVKAWMKDPELSVAVIICHESLRSRLNDGFECVFKADINEIERIDDTGGKLKNIIFVESDITKFSAENFSELSVVNANMNSDEGYPRRFLAEVKNRNEAYDKLFDNHRIMLVTTPDHSEIKRLLYRMDIDGDIQLDYSCADTLARELSDCGVVKKDNTTNPEIIQKTDARLTLQNPMRLMNLRGEIKANYKVLSAYAKGLGSDPLVSLTGFTGKGPKAFYQEAAAAIKDWLHAREKERKKKAKKNEALVDARKENLDISRTSSIRKSQDLAKKNNLINIVVYGNPGTGKTTLARLYGKALSRSGVLSVGHVVERRVSELKGDCIGASTANMRAAIEEAKGGVLFLDEFHKFYNDTENTATVNGTRGDPYIEELQQAFFNALLTTPDTAFIVAGYKTGIEKILEQAEGLSSRFRENKVELPDYDEFELFDIAVKKLQSEEIRFREDYSEDELKELLASNANEPLTKDEFRDYLTNWYIDYLGSDKDWGNARTLEEMLDGLDCNFGEPITHKSFSDSQKQFDKPYCFMTKKQLTEKLDQYAGMDEAKKVVCSLYDWLFDITDGKVTSETLSKLREQTETDNYFLVGEPGTGKSSFARTIGEVLREFRALKTGRFIETTWNKVISPEQMADMLKIANGNALFIDEAAGFKEVSQGSLDLLNTYMVNEGKYGSCVILAGYERNQADMNKKQEGLERRLVSVPFPSYTAAELYDIFERRLKNATQKMGIRCVIKSDAKTLLERLFAAGACPENAKRFGNGGGAAAACDHFVPLMGNTKPGKSFTIKKKNVEAFIARKRFDAMIARHTEVQARKEACFDLGNGVCTTSTKLNKNDEAAFLEDLKNKVVLLTNIVNDNSYGEGTGFMFDSGGYIATCAHVVEGADKLSARIRMLDNDRDMSFNVDCFVAAIDNANDLAILRLDDREGKKFPVCALAPRGTTVKANDKIFNAGFSAGHQGGGFDAQVDSGTVRSKRREGEYLMNMITVQGASGSPIFNDSSQVIGYHWGAPGQSENGKSEINAFYTVDYLWDLIEKKQ